MNRDLLIPIYSIAVICFSLAATAAAQDEVVSTIVDDAATLDITAVSGVRSVIIREGAIQQDVTPSIATKTTAPNESGSTNYLLPSVDTISGAEIRTKQRYDLKGIFDHSAGVHVIQSGQAGATSSIFIRGMESNHTVVLLNGRRLPPGLAGLYQIEFFDTSTLESVQVLRGGASSLYGSDALAGAIDLRSTDARFVQENTVSGYVEGGSFETLRTGGKVTIREGNVGIALDGSFLDTQNDRPSSDHNNGILRGNIAVELGDGVFFDILGYVQDSFLEVPGSSTNPAFPAAQINDNRSGLFSPRLSVIQDDWDFYTFYSYTTNELIADRNAFTFLNNSLEQTGHEAEAVLNYHPTDEATYTIGAGYYGYEFERNPLVPSPFTSGSAFDHSYTSIFAQADVDLPANFHLLASGRYDDHDKFESKGTYTVQLGNTLENTGTFLFGKVATGYKAPSGQDFIFLSPTVDPATLNPEESFTWELGFRQPLLNDTASIAVTYFQANIDNLVDADPITFIDPAVVDTETEGVEVEWRHNLSDFLSWYLNYTWLDAIITDGQYFSGFQGGAGDRLTRRPAHTLSAGFVMQSDHWNAGAEITGAYDRLDAPDVFLDDYTIARIFGAVEVSDNIEIYGCVENLFDHDYETTTGFEAAGLGAFGGVRILLGKSYPTGK